MIKLGLGPQQTKTGQLPGFIVYPKTLKGHNGALTLQYLQSLGVCYPSSCHQATLLPGCTVSDTVDNIKRPSLSLAASTMPCETTPINLTGLRLATIIT